MEQGNNPVSLDVVNKITAKTYLPYLQAERDSLLKHPMVFESLMPGITEAHIKELDEIISSCHKILGET